MTREKGIKNNYIFGIPDPDLPIHYATFIGLRRRLTVVYSRAVQCESRFRSKNFCFRRNGAQNGNFVKESGVETLDFGIATLKGHFPARNRVA